MVPAVHADQTLISNLPSNDGGYGYVSSSTFRAFSFTTSSDTFNITSVTMRLFDYDTVTQGDVALLSIRLDDGSNAPSASVYGALVAPTSSSSGTYGHFVFTPESAITLAGNTQYWLVIASSSPTEDFAWVRSNPSVTPTGIATAGQQDISDAGNSGWREGNDGPHSFSISGVPEPGTCALVGIGLGLAVWMGRRR